LAATTDIYVIKKEEKYEMGRPTGAQCVHGQQMLAGSGTDHAVRSGGDKIPKKRGWILAVNKFGDKLRTRVRLRSLHV
jgi:hypothetical protein